MRKWFEKFMSTVWPTVKAILIDQLKGRAVKLAIKTFIKSGAAGGFVGWVVTFVTTELIEEIGIPIMNALQVEVVYVYDRQVGKVLAKRINQAREDGDATAYDNASDDIMGG